jgi:hypothetical protein
MDDAQTHIGAVNSFCKNFIPSYVFDALLCRNWPFSAPNRLTLRIIILVYFVRYFEQQCAHD